MNHVSLGLGDLAQNDLDQGDARLRNLQFEPRGRLIGEIRHTRNAKQNVRLARCGDQIRN
jgi:hypothetical protein